MSLSIWQVNAVLTFVIYYLNMANSYTNEEILKLFYIHGECNRIINRTCRTFNDHYPDLVPMNKKKFNRIENNFKNNGQIKQERTQIKPVTGNEDNQINVLAYFVAFPHASIFSAEKDLGISYKSIERILHAHGMHNYKFVTLQAIEPNDPPQRVEFCEMVLVRTQEDPNYLNKIIWTDESKFTREGVFNRRNSHYWAAENPHFVREAGFQYKFGFNVFCIMMNDKIKFCFYDENLNSQKYLEILRTIVSDFLDELSLETLRHCWYQLDGAPAHCTNEVTNELTQMFEDRWIRRLGPWNWPPRSPDLTPLDFYLWGRIKQLVYDTPVHTKEELQNRVREAFLSLKACEIQAATTDHVMTEILNCLKVNGGRFKQFSY